MKPKQPGTTYLRYTLAPRTEAYLAIVAPYRPPATHDTIRLSYLRFDKPELPVMARVVSPHRERREDAEVIAYCKLRDLHEAKLELPFPAYILTLTNFGEELCVVEGSAVWTPAP